MIPCNDYILIEPIEEKVNPEDSPVYVPNRAKMMQKGRVVSVGSSQCVLFGIDQGISQVVYKNDLIPGLGEGSTVFYRKTAEDRTNMDAAIRQKIDGKDFLLIKIFDILGIEP